MGDLTPEDSVQNLEGDRSDVLLTPMGPIA